MSCKHGFPTDVMHCDLCCGEDLAASQKDTIELAHALAEIRLYLPPGSVPVTEKYGALIDKALALEARLKMEAMDAERERQTWEKIQAAPVTARLKKVSKARRGR